MQIKQSTLVILSPGFPADESDSVCLPSQQIFVRLLNEMFPAVNLIVIAFEYPFSRSIYLWNSITIMGLNGRNKGKKNRLLVWWKAWNSIRKIIREKDIIGILSFWCGETALIGKYASQVWNIPHYCWILGQDAKKNNKYLRLIRPKGEELVALSDFLAEELYRNYQIKIDHVIPNGVHPALFNSNENIRDIDLLGAGSLIPLKQYDLFIRLVYKIKMFLPSVNAIICGKGPEENHLRSLISELKLEDNISLIGERPHREVLNLMQRARILLHTSSYEGFSTVCLEALYAGAQVISFCRAMNNEIPHWHIVATREEMLNKLSELLNDPEPDQKPVLAYSMQDSVKAMMHLFGR